MGCDLPDTLAQSYRAHATEGPGFVAAVTGEEGGKIQLPHLIFFLLHGGYRDPRYHCSKVLGLPEGSWKENQTVHWGNEGTLFSAPAIISRCTEGEYPCSHGGSGRIFKPRQPIFRLINLIDLFVFVQVLSSNSCFVFYAVIY